MPRLSEARLRDRYETILDAAEQVLGRGGFAEASVGEVARQAGGQARLPTGAAAVLVVAAR